MLHLQQIYSGTSLLSCNGHPARPPAGMTDQTVLPYEFVNSEMLYSNQVARSARCRRQRIEKPRVGCCLRLAEAHRRQKRGADLRRLPGLKGPGEA